VTPKDGTWEKLLDDGRYVFTAELREDLKDDSVGFMVATDCDVERRFIDIFSGDSWDSCERWAGRKGYLNLFGISSRIRSTALPSRLASYPCILKALFALKSP